MSHAPDGPLDVIKAAKAQALAESHALRAEARADAPDLPPQLIWGWAIEAHCPGCDSQLQHVTTGRPGLEVRAVAGCPGCGRTFTIAASLTDVSTDLGRHPAMVWPTGFDDGLTALDRLYLEQGWRQAWLWNERAA